MWIPIAVVAVLLLIIVGMYNGLIGKKNQVHNIFGTMDAMLKKRWDLLPNLVSTVKGYMQHEKELLEQVTRARSEASRPGLSPDQSVAVDNHVTAALGLFMAKVEDYPDLKASDNAMHLQRTLVELEEQISAARRAFNASVNDYNNAVQMFPTSLMASMMGYKTKNFFSIPEEERQARSVS